MSLSAQTEYTYTEAIFSIPEKGIEIDILNSMLELTIYESVKVPYLTARMIVSDSERVFDAIKLNGTERFSVGITSPQRFEYKRNFIVTRTEQKVKVGEQAYGYVFYLTEETFVLDVLKKISRAYRGTTDEIIKHVLSSEFNKTLEIHGQPPVQSAFSYVSPFLSPLAIIETIRKRATTEAGFPYFVYATLTDEKIRMKSVASMIEDEPINERPYTYSAAQTASNDKAAKLLTIEDWEYLGKNDTMEMVMKGAVQNQYNVINLSTNRRNKNNRFNIMDMIDAQDNSIYNKSFKIADKKISEYDPNVIYRIVNHTTMDELGYHDEQDIEHHSNKLKSHAIRQALNKHAVRFSINGLVNFSGFTLIGNQINVEILNGDVTKNDDPVDTTNSGAYMVLESRHVFVNQKYTQVLTCSKLSHSDKPTIPVGPSGFPSL